MKLYGGIDLHSNNNVISIKDEHGEVKVRRKLPNDLMAIFSFLAPFKDELTGIVIESTYNWYWLVDALMESGFCVHLANTTAIQQYSGLKYADDNSDADWLAEMLRLDILPVGYIYPKEERTIRDLMRKRMQLVQQCTKNLLAIQGIYTRHLNNRISNNKIKQLTSERIEADFSSANVALAAKCGLTVMNCLREQIKNIEKSILASVKLRPEFQQLKSIDGFGR
jgi:transposase